MILEQCKGVHCVDLGESFQTHIYLQKLASIEPRTSPVKAPARVVMRVRRRADRAGGAGISRAGALLTFLFSTNFADLLGIF